MASAIPSEIELGVGVDQVFTKADEAAAFEHLGDVGHVTAGGAIFESEQTPVVCHAQAQGGGHRRAGAEPTVGGGGAVARLDSRPIGAWVQRQGQAVRRYGIATSKAEEALAIQATISATQLKLAPLDARTAIQ